MRFAQAVAIDVVAVLLFAVVGRSAHAESNDLLGVAETAWPFLAGLALGTVLSRAWRRPTATSTAVIIWLSTVVAGLALRVLAGSTAAWPFVIVATVTLGLLLVGWRLAARAIRRVRHNSNRGVPTAP